MSYDFGLVPFAIQGSMTTSGSVKAPWRSTTSRAMATVQHASTGSQEVPKKFLMFWITVGWIARVMTCHDILLATPGALLVLSLVGNLGHSGSWIQKTCQGSSLQLATVLAYSGHQSV